VEIRVWDAGDRVYSNMTKTFYVLEGGKYNISIYRSDYNNYVSYHSLYINSTNEDNIVKIKWMSDDPRTLRVWILKILKFLCLVSHNLLPTLWS